MGQQGASNTATKRLLRELMEASHIAEDTGSSTDGNSPNPVLVLRPVSDDNLFEWTAVITSSEVDSPYEGGKFKLAINVPSNYPLQPPNMKFISKVCHPNVHFNTGEICLDLLKSSWSPAWTLKSACVAVSLLLDDPAPDSPLNCDIANLLRCNDRRGYNSLIRMYTSLHAMEENDP